MSIQVSSHAFEPGGAIPREYTGEGRDVSPPLAWSGLPEGARELALVCGDPDAPTPRPFVHWVLYKIPAERSGVPEGSAAAALEGKNDFGGTGYGGPMPHRRHGTHRYRFRLCALDAELEADSGLTRDELLRAIEGHVLAEGELVGTYERR
jgi:Raf kinase inhibitor-like YbhB/YbcL family protein